MGSYKCPFKAIYGDSIRVFGLGVYLEVHGQL